jgi:hypothetical protein
MPEARPQLPLFTSSEESRIVQDDSSLSIKQIYQTVNTGTA